MAHSLNNCLSSPAGFQDSFVDNVDQDQTPQKVQSDLESTLSGKKIFSPEK